ncbi:FxLYD domain-containing protein [Halobacterium salinarum]|uniref:FxLYD domain-containing protein n=1 Tax=Halobacterium salinarum TaxID=2242 RepID=UPI0025522E0C|nr:FxLYD domain-containing protein [Halobacterium salinarum]MDL0144692.1 FxLYD domain-containing protein [Halobacterium salinarum]
MELNRRRYLATLGTTASALTLAGCSESDSEDSGGGNANDNSGDSSNGNSDNSGGNDQSDVEILSHEFYEDEFSVGVRGTAKNNTDSELSYVQAEAVFLDESDTQIGEGLANVSDLAAGRKWEFDCMFLGDEPSRIDTYEIELSTGF